VVITFGKRAGVESVCPTEPCVNAVRDGFRLALPMHRAGLVRRGAQ